jgi:hypothetical protein
MSRVSAAQADSEFARVISVQALPGTGWTVLDQRAWKTGKSGSDEAWALRARQAKLVTVWRSFEQPLPHRWLWTQVTQLVSAAEAAAALEAAPNRLLANTKAQVTVVSTQRVQQPELQRQTLGWRTSSRQMVRMDLVSRSTPRSSLARR